MAHTEREALKLHLAVIIGLDRQKHHAPMPRAPTRSRTKVCLYAMRQFRAVWTLVLAGEQKVVGNPVALELCARTTGYFLSARASSVQVGLKPRVVKDDPEGH